jgi:hypothetical protein
VGCSAGRPHFQTEYHPSELPSFLIPEQKSVGSSVRVTPADTVAFIHRTQLSVAVPEATEASCARRVRLAQLAKDKERARTVTERNFIVASDIRHDARSTLSA